MAHRSEYPRSKDPLVLVGTVVCVVLLTVGGAWWAASAWYEDSPDRPDVGDTSDAAVTVQDCRFQWTAQVTPLRVAETSVSQWQLHVDAMNQLVAGEITLNQAVAFWNQTRVDAVEKIDAFGVAWSSYRKGDYACRQGQDPALDRCQRSVHERETVLQLAFDAVDTWHHHVMDMRSLMSGEITPEDALARWKHFWRQGIGELNRYHDALRQTGTQKC